MDKWKYQYKVNLECRKVSVLKQILLYYIFIGVYLYSRSLNLNLESICIRVQTRMRLNSPDTLLRDDGTTDGRVLQLTENHRQQLSELKLRNDRLKDEKASKCNFAWHK